MVQDTLLLVLCVRAWSGVVIIIVVGHVAFADQPCVETILRYSCCAVNSASFIVVRHGGLYRTLSIIGWIY
jgi:hypothetical protein